MRSNDFDLFSFMNERTDTMVKNLQEDLFEINLKVKQALDKGVSMSEVDSLRALLECSEISKNFVDSL